QAGAPGFIFYLARAETGPTPGGRGAGPMAPTAALHRYDLEKRKDETIQAAVVTYELTADGRKMLYASSPTSGHIDSSSPAMGGLAAMLGAGAGRGGAGGAAGGAASPGVGETKNLNLDAIEVRVDPP